MGARTNPNLDAALGVVVVDGGRGGESPEGDAGGVVVGLIVGVGRGHELVGKNYKKMSKCEELSKNRSRMHQLVLCCLVI